MREKSKYKIKRSNNEELLKKLHTITFPEDQWCGLKDTVAWVVWFGKEPVGFCLMCTTDKFFASYTRAGVKSKHQGNGLHTRMINVREKHARLMGYEKVITYTKMDNITSIANLQKRGYLIYEPKNKYADDDCIYWQKEL